MPLNRKLIKSQAREMISGNVFSLFLVSLVVILLANTTSFASNIINYVNDIKQSDFLYSDEFFKYRDGDNTVDDWLDDFGFGDSYDSDNPIDNFNGQITPVSEQKTEIAKPKMSLFSMSTMYFIAMALSLISLFFMTLTIAHEKFYLEFIRTGRKPKPKDDLKKIFSDTFKNNFGKRLSLVFLIGIFTFLWMILFIVPGIIYAISVSFSYKLMADNPNLSPMEAINLSKKITKGHKGELFTLGLSFFPWYLLMGVTAGIAGIYVIPYTQTTYALYYQNFLLRAKATGAVREDDFLSSVEKFQKYGSRFYTPNPNYYPQGAPYGPYAAPQNGQPYAPQYGQPNTPPPAYRPPTYNGASAPQYNNVPPRQNVPPQYQNQNMPPQANPYVTQPPYSPPQATPYATQQPIYYTPPTVQEDVPVVNNNDFAQNMASTPPNAAYKQDNIVSQPVADENAEPVYYTPPAEETTKKTVEDSWEEPIKDVWEEDKTDENEI